MAGLVRYRNNDIVNDTKKVVTSTWSNNTNNLTTLFTSSTQFATGTATSSGAFFIDVYNGNPHTANSTAEVQFSVAYGHKKGSGSLDFTNDTGAIGNSPTKCIYNQYRQLVYGDETSDFSFNGHIPEDIYVINVERARFKHNLKPGTLDLRLTSGAAGGTEDTIHLTDDSVTLSGSATITNAGRQFNLVSGSLGIMSGSSLTQVAGSGSYGFFYPDSGFIVLNPDALVATGTTKGLSGSAAQGGIGPIRRANTEEKNHERLFLVMSHSTHFIVDSEEKVSSQYYFKRARNDEFNYTTNPSFIDSNGNLNYTSMIDSPQTYITTVGLYNDMGDLVAVAKLSQPVAKDFTKEALIRVKLDY